MTATTMRVFSRSKCKNMAATHPDAVCLGVVPDDRTVQLTIVLKPKTVFSHARFKGQGAFLSRHEYARDHGCTSDVMDSVAAYATSHGLKVSMSDPVRHVVRVEGTVKDAIAAFTPDKLELFRINGTEKMGREGCISIPDSLAPHIVAVMGFDERPIAKPHFRIRAAQSGATSYSPIAVAKRYGFPTNLTGAGQTIALIELGGGYVPAQMASYFAGLGVDRTGTLQAVSVGSASNAPDNDPSGADGEVQLDIEVAGSVAPAANIAVYFGANQGSGFLDAVNDAIHDQTRNPGVISISWGGPESSWSPQDMDAMDQAFQTGATLGITVCAASGDNGATDGTSNDVADFPASSPHVLGCGGTHLPQSGAETAWNDGSSGGATGGGYSTQFAKPSWQTGNAETKRGVPDVAGDADPETGYNVTVDGTATVIGGTSAAAPLWAGLIALANQQAGHNSGLINATLYANPSAFNDITSGNNNGFQTAKGWDPVTGLGSPKGAEIVKLLQGASS